MTITLPISFDDTGLVQIFSGLNLPASTYWLTIYSNGPSTDLEDGWGFTSVSNVTTTPGAAFDITEAGLPPVAGYAPASTPALGFWNPNYAAIMEVDAAAAAPEPSTWGLFAAVLACILFGRKRALISRAR